MKWLDAILNFLSKIRCRCRSGCGGEIDYNTPLAVSGNNIKDNIYRLKEM